MLISTDKIIRILNKLNYIYIEEALLFESALGL
jgi:hypothetical protein